ncbi:MAG: VCBS repeat-containing protein [Candidatus Delongbacteria bacterium]|nr:VCBS repeat-containing protein [Candidatus Delongbacteria bacterium]
MADFIDISRTKGMPLCSLEYSTSGIAWNCLNHQLIPDDYFPEAFITSYETGNVPVIEFYLNDSSGFTNIGPRIIVSGKMVPIEPGSNLCPGLLNLDHQKSLDLILLNTRGAVYRYFNLSLGIRPTMESYDFLPAGLNPDLTGYGTGDLNNDNYPDFILTPRYQPPILYLSNNDPISKNTPPLYPFRQRCDTRQVLIFDINRDQFKDIYFINFGRPNTFYLNLGNGQFLEQSCPLGIDLCAGSTGAAVADYNHDGWIDIFVTGYGVSRLFINREGVKFDDRTHSFRAGYTGYCNDATAGDFDNDGFIDLYLAIGNPDASPAKSNLLLKNHRGEYFESLSDLITGISESSTCATWVDYNNDGHLDLWVGNHGKNRMFENRDQTPNSIRLNLQAGLSGTHTNLPAYNGEFILLDPSGQELCRKQIIYDREPGNSLIFTGIEAGITYTIRIIHPWLSQPYEITGQAGRQLVLDGIY